MNKRIAFESHSGKSSPLHNTSQSLPKLGLPQSGRVRRMECGLVMTSTLSTGQRELAVVVSSATAFGSLSLPSETIDRQFGMAVGKLRNRAGIRSVSQVAPDETEVSLGTRAALAALAAGGIAADSCDWIFASSETHHTIPSLAAELHAHLHLPESCGAMDIGGACLGLLNALATAQTFVTGGRARRILIVTSDVHSRTLTPDRVRGEFGGLFGDGATAFVVQSASNSSSQPAFALGEFFFGCAAQFAKAIEIKDSANGDLNVVFEGEALSRAAIAKMNQVISEVERRSGISRQDAIGFATHQPNPRLVTLLAKQAGVAPERFPPVAEVHGNLGSSTCGAALHQLLLTARELNPNMSTPIFLASLGPGLLYGGGWLVAS
jgi:3-oxoacyl-[acyl-carrier-protein] synthase-3